MFDTTKHFSEGAIQKRNQERLKLQELEEERKKEKKREEEVAERKRKDEIRKAQEKRRKARERRRALKERDRHQQRKEKVKAKAEAQQELDCLEEWEERKYLLAQRRVEALRLLRVLLKKIEGSTQCNTQEVNIMKPEVHHTLGTTMRSPEEEELNTQPFLDWEEMSSRQVSKPDRKQKQKVKKRTQLQKSFHGSNTKQIRYSTRKEEIGKVLTNEYDYSLISDQNSSRSTIILDHSLDKEDEDSFNESYSFRQTVINHGRKQKIYETDEFIHYLLNYYQTPEYARFCLETSHSTSMYQWQRNVYAKGDGFQINLRKHRCHSDSLSEVESLEGKEEDQEQGWSEVYMKDPESKSKKTSKISDVKKFTKKFKDHYKDIASETDNHLYKTDEESYPVEKIHSHGVKDPQHTGRSPVFSSVRSVDVGLPLADFLEEISSDSECFSENLSINEEEEERSVAVYSSSPDKRPHGTDKTITCKQRKSRSAEWKHDSEERSSKHKVRAPGKRSKYELSYSWHEDECDSVQVDKNMRKTRENLPPRYMFDEGYYYESIFNNEVESSTRKRRRVISTIDQNVKYRPLHLSLIPPKHARAFHLGYFSRKRQNPWMSEYNRM